MASIKALDRKKGRVFKVIWYADGTQRTRSFPTEGEAKAYKVKVEGSLLDGTYRDPRLGREQLGGFLARTLDVRPMSRSGDRGLKPKTLAHYNWLAGRHLLAADFPEAVALRSRPIGRVTSDLIEEYLGALENVTTPATVHAVFVLLRRTLSIAIDKGLAPSPNPCSRIRVARPGRHEQRYLSAVELATLAEEVPPWDRALILVLGYGGLRWGEAVALQRRHVDVLRGRVTVAQSMSEIAGRLVLNPTPKSGKPRTVKVPRFVAEALADHLKTFVGEELTAPVFTTRTGTLLRNSNFRRETFDKACARAGLEPKPRVHDLRHTAAALAVAAGYHPKAVQEMLGHSSIAVTMDVYAHLFDTLQDEAVDRLDAIARGAKPREAAKVVALR